MTRTSVQLSITWDPVNLKLKFAFTGDQDQMLPCPTPDAAQYTYSARHQNLSCAVEAVVGGSAKASMVGFYTEFQSGGMLLSSLQSASLLEKCENRVETKEQERRYRLYSKVQGNSMEQSAIRLDDVLTAAVGESLNEHLLKATANQPGVMVFSRGLVFNVKMDVSGSAGSGTAGAILCNINLYGVGLVPISVVEYGNSMRLGDGSVNSALVTDATRNFLFSSLPWNLIRSTSYVPSGGILSPFYNYQHVSTVAVPSRGNFTVGFASAYETFTTTWGGIAQKSGLKAMLGVDNWVFTTGNRLAVEVILVGYLASARFSASQDVGSTAISFQYSPGGGLTVTGNNVQCNQGTIKFESQTAGGATVVLSSVLDDCNTAQCQTMKSMGMFAYRGYLSILQDNLSTWKYDPTVQASSPPNPDAPNNNNNSGALSSSLSVGLFTSLTFFCVLFSLLFLA